MRKIHARFAEFRWTNRVVWSSPAMFLTTGNVSSLRKTMVWVQNGHANLYNALYQYWEFFSLHFLFYGILLMLSRCCFHHILENSILYKKDIQHFYIGPILYSEIKSNGRWSAEKLTVKFHQEWETENFIWHQGWETEKFIWHQMTVSKNFTWQSKG